jgi:hypothetical protein
MRNNLELMLIESAKLSKYDVCIITGDGIELFSKSNNFLVQKLSKVIALITSHVDLGRKIVKNKEKDAIIVYAFSTEFLFLSFLVSFLTRNVYLVNGYNIQQAYESPIMNLVLKLYHYLGYKFIVLETSSVLRDLGYQEKDLVSHISMLHSVVDNNNINNFAKQVSGKKKIGIIGESRRGKKFSKTLDLMLEISKKLDVVLTIGTNDFSCFDDVDLQGIELIDTSTNDAYMSVLSACDAIVLNYEKSKYFYRCSGVAADAISVKTYAICPDFPLMSSQVNYPTQVGIVYQDEQDLELAVRQALDLIDRSDKSEFESHYTERSIAKAASIIDRAIQANA